MGVTALEVGSPDYICGCQRNPDGSRQRRCEESANPWHDCGQFTREETRGKVMSGDGFAWQGHRWLVVHATPNWVYAKPVGC